MVEEHTLYVDIGFISDDWNSSCSCGWDGPDRRTRDDAIEDWEHHCDVVFMDATMQRVDDV